MSIFGDIFDPTVLEDAAAPLIAAWMPAYVRELERQRSLPAGRIAIPSGPDVVTDPASPTLDSGQQAHMWLWTGDPEDVAVDGDSYSAAWPLYVRVDVIAATHQRARLIARIYVAAVRALLLQHGSLGGVASNTRWVGESYGDEPPVQERSRSMCTVDFRVQVNDVVTQGTPSTFPSVPPGDPVPDPGDAPEVVDGTATVTFLAPTETV